MKEKGSMLQVTKNLILAMMLFTLAFGGSIDLLAEIPLEHKIVQVIYQVDYMDVDTGEKVQPSVRKIDFSGNTVLEKGEKIYGYELVTEPEVTVELLKENNAPIVFEYRKIDTEALERLKVQTVEKIKALKKADRHVKDEYIEKVEKAYLEKEVNDIYAAIEQIDADTKVIVRYQVKYLDIFGKERARTVTKLAFSGETVTEAAEAIEGFTLLSDEKKTLELGLENNEIVFEYKRTEPLIVKYQVKNVDEAGQVIGWVVTKLAFAGETVTEKADRIKGYYRKDKKEKTLRLTEENNEPIVFVYGKVDEAGLQKAKDSAINEINALKKAKKYDKEDYIEQVQKAYTEQEVRNLLADIKKIDEQTQVIVKYHIKYVDADGNNVFDPVTKLAFAGEIVEEEAPEPLNDDLARPKSKRLTLDPVKENTIEFVYHEWEDTISLKDFINRKLNPKGVQAPYRDTNFAGRPKDLQEFVIKSIYNRALFVEFYATEQDVDDLYWNLWNKATDASLVRLARFWTGREDVRREETETKGVYRYAIGITYHASLEDIKKAEDKIDEIIDRYQLLTKTDFQKAKTIHDYLVKYITPDPDPSKFGYNRYNHTMILLENTGVCEGYTIAFNRIAERAGLESKFVPGATFPPLPPKVLERYWNVMLKQMNTETFDKKLNHAWNQVKINGKWYHLDSYHGSYFYHSTEPGSKTQIYYAFLKSQRYLWDILKNRIWNYNFTEESLENYPGLFRLDETI